jgi:hypothetical protein
MLITMDSKFDRWKLIRHELVHHLPLTLVGAATGIILILSFVLFGILEDVESVSHPIFFVLHPGHVALSAIATTSLFMKYGKRKVWLAVLVGIVGSLGIATLSDSIMPYMGELLLDLPHSEAHIGFIEEPIITIGAAIIGVVIGYFIKHNRFPHSGHVFISTWASLFHVIMAMGGSVDILHLLVIFVLLFVAVWLPCCLSDIVFPLLFSSRKEPVPQHYSHHHNV